MPTTAPDRVREALTRHRDAIAETARRRAAHDQVVRELADAEREAAARVVDGDADAVLARVAHLKAKADAFAAAVAAGDAAERAAERAITEAQAAVRRAQLADVGERMRAAAAAAEALVAQLVPHLQALASLEREAMGVASVPGGGMLPSPLQLGRDVRVVAVRVSDGVDFLEHNRAPLHQLAREGWGIVAGVNQFLGRCGA